MDKEAGRVRTVVRAAGAREEQRGPAAGEIKNVRRPVRRRRIVPTADDRLERASVTHLAIIDHRVDGSRERGYNGSGHLDA